MRNILRNIALTILFLTTYSSLGHAQAVKPRLMINIVVSSMPMTSLVTAITSQQEVSTNSAMGACGLQTLHTIICRLQLP